MRILIDTNVYSAMRRDRPEMKAIVHRSSEILVPIVAIGELLSGFRGGSRYDSNRRELDDFLAEPYISIVNATATTADRFALIASRLKVKGRPIPSNDVWIAAQAMETGASLVSYDGHFAHVDEIDWIKPSDS